MLSKSYAKDKNKNWHSKYHTIKKQIAGTTYDLFQNKVLSKFHRLETIQIVDLKTIEVPFNNSVNSTLLPRIKTNVGKFSYTLKYFLGFHNHKSKVTNVRIDWRRGRFLGKVQKITIRKGVIVSKTFLTPRGALITVKRCELGIGTSLLMPSDIVK